AATLLDIGRSVDFFERHAHVADLVLATDLNGFTHRGVALLSAVLRAAGSDDGDLRPYAPLLDDEDQPAIAPAAPLLVLADDIEERCPDGIPLEMECRVRKDDVLVVVPALLAWRPRTVGKRFHKAFGRQLVVKAGG